MAGPSLCIAPRPAELTRQVQVPALEAHRAPGDARRVGREPQQRQRRHRLAGTALASNQHAPSRLGHARNLLLHASKAAL